MENLVSKEYKEKLVAFHSKRRWGYAFTKDDPVRVNAFMRLSGANSLLDYGAGYGEFKNQVNGQIPDAKYSIHEYEPGIVGKDEDPPACDATVCFDVLEHVEPSKIDDVLQHIYDKTNKWAYLVICCVPARKTFPDGQNLHLLVQQPKWWIDKLKDNWDILKQQRTGPRKDGLKMVYHLKVLLIKK